MHRLVRELDERRARIGGAQHLAAQTGPALDALEAADRWTPRGYLEGAGYRGDECAVVMDASAWWQDGDHTKGKTSDKALRSRRWAGVPSAIRIEAQLMS